MARGDGGCVILIALAVIRCMHAPHPGGETRTYSTRSTSDPWTPLARRGRRLGRLPQL